MGNGHYLAYYELHEIPWELLAAVRFKDEDAGTIFELGRGPYHVPRLASPKVSIRAGGARIETVNENYVLEGGTYFGIAVPVRLGDEKASATIEPGFDRLWQLTEDAARVVGLCLDQRIPLKQVAAYVKENRNDGMPARMLTMWQLQSGAAACVSHQSAESIRVALSSALSVEISPQVQLALRWYDLSKAATVGPDRLVALWIALEALMAPVNSHAALMRKTCAHLARAEYGSGLNPEQIRDALGFDKMLEYRNQIMHRGSWPVPWPVVPGDPHRRDWPQILCDVVGEILRISLSAGTTGTLRRHIENGLRMLG